MKRLFNKASIIYKLLFIFIILIIIINLVLIQLVALSKKDIDKKSIALLESKIEYAFKSIEHQILSIREQQMHVINDTKLFRITNSPTLMSQYEKVDYLNSLRNEMGTIELVYPIADNVNIYILTIDKVIKGSQICNITREDISCLNRKLKRNNDIIQYDNETFIISNNQFQFNTIDGIDIPIVTVETSLNSNTITDVVNSLISDENVAFSFYLLDTKKTIVSNVSNDEEIINDLVEKTENNKSIKANQYIVTHFISNNNYYFTIESSRINIGCIFKTKKTYFRYKKFTFLFIIVSIIMLSIVTSFFLIIRVMINKPIKKMIMSFKRVEAGELAFELTYKRNDEFSLLYNGFNSMLKRIRELIHEVYEQKILRQQAQLKQLQYQINPHFLYNSLLVLYETIKFGDNENAKKMTQHLSSYYRYITKSQRDIISLKGEMDHINNYVQLQMMRHTDRIDFDISNIPKNLENLEVPRLLLQPIVENSYKHGMKNIEEDGIIRLWFEESESTIRIIIEDNGDELTDNEIEEIKNGLKLVKFKNKKTGIMNVHRRIQLMFGEESGIRVSRSSLGGMSVMIEIVKGGEAFV